MKLIVLNLSRRMTEDDLRALFTQYGEVAACNLVMDEATGKSKGFGFVEMRNPGDGVMAQLELDGKRVQTRRIRVKEAKQ